MAADVPIVVGIDWLAANRDRVSVLDVRDPWEYEAIGHVPDAANVPFDRFRSAGGDDEGMLPGADTFARLMGEAGIAPDDTVVVYDDEHGVFAARVLVTALLYGHEDVHLLDGDYSAWSRAHETSTDPPRIEPTDYDVSPPDDRPLIDGDEVKAAIDAGAVLVDTRSPEEFREGHIAGAVNLDWREFVDPDTRGLLPPDRLRAILESHGIAPDRRVVLYCNTARRISHTYVVLRHLGYRDVDFYEGSLTDWNARGYDLVSETADDGKVTGG